MDNSVTNILFYLALDEIRDNNIVNAYPAVIKTQLLDGENTRDGFSLVDFDNYKGSFLKLSAKESIAIVSKSDEGIILNDESDYAFNFYFSYETTSDSLTLLTINDEISLAIQRTQEASALVLRWHGEEIYISTGDASHAAIQQRRWYNLNVLIRANGQISVALGNKETTLSESIHIKKPYRISNIQIRGNEAEGVINVAEFYMLENPTPGTTAYLIKKGVNPNLKLDWLSNISFDIYSKVESELKKGIYITEEPTERYLKITTNKDTLKLTPLAGDGYYHVVLKFKKGFVGIESASLTDQYKYEESTTDIVLYGRLHDGTSTIRLPDMAIINATGQSYTLVQCQLQYLAVSAENYSMVLEEPLYFDKKIPLYGLDGKQHCPFEILALSDGKLLNDGETEQTITLRLCNVSEESIIIPALDQNNKAGLFAIGSAHMAILRDCRRANVKIVNYTSKKRGEGLSAEITQEINLAPNAFIDIIIENLIAGKPSAMHPSGTYPFFLSYENIQGYANGRVPFYLKTGKIIPRDKESVFAKEKLEDDVVFLKSQINFLQEQFTLFVKNQKAVSIKKNSNYDALLLDVHIETVARKRLFTTNGHDDKILELVSVPIGCIVAYGGSNIPDGWLLCDGESIDKKYALLRDLMSDNGYCTPDLRDKFLVGAGGQYKLGDVGGKEAVMLTEKHMPNHSHSINGGEFYLHHRSFDGAGGKDQPFKSSPDDNGRKVNNGRTDAIGGNEAHENRPPYRALYYIIKAL